MGVWGGCVNQPQTETLAPGDEEDRDRVFGGICLSQRIESGPDDVSDCFWGFTSPLHRRTWARITTVSSLLLFFFFS